LFTAQGAGTGVTYTTQRIPAGETTVNQALKDMDKALGDGVPVPIVVGSSTTNYAHYVLVTGVNKGPPKTYTVHDPGAGVTSTETESDFKNGTLSQSGWNQLQGVEVPSY